MIFNQTKGSAFFIPALIILLASVSCSRTEPRINHGFIELVYYSDRSGVQERFSFFVLSEDDDGIENLAELYLYHDREGLRWLISSEDWVTHTDEGGTWIGSRSISMPDRTVLPRGQYRSVLVNKGGERTERRFTFDGPERSPHPFPTLTVTDDEFRVNSRYPVNRFVCYDQQGRVVDIISITSATGTIEGLRLPSSVRTAALWAEDPEYRISAFTEAVLVR